MPNALGITDLQSSSPLQTICSSYMEALSTINCKNYKDIKELSLYGAQQLGWLNG